MQVSVTMLKLSINTFILYTTGITTVAQKPQIAPGWSPAIQALSGSFSDNVANVAGGNYNGGVIIG